MRVLFVVENLSCQCGANVNIVMKLAKYLTQENEIFVLARNSSDKPLDLTKVSLFSDVFSFQDYRSEYVSSFQKKNNWAGCSNAKKIFLFLLHPKIWMSMMDAKYNDYSLTKRKYQKEIEKLCDIHKFDIVIGVAAPYFIARAVGESSIHFKKMVFQLDPYSFNYTLPHFQIKRRVRTERKLIRQIDKLFAVSFVKNEIEKKEITHHMKKIVSFELPGIELEDNVVSEAKMTDANSNLVHFFFIGQFYETIRNPSFLLELFCLLPNHYILHLVGGGTPTLIERYKKKLGKRLVCHGQLSSAEAMKKMQEADILVNLNNTIKNQLASKLFEYINTGKPILNICKNKDCLSLKYTEKYGNCMDIMETSVICDELIKRIISFVSTNKGYVVNRTDILKKFKENTDEYVAQVIHAAMKKCVAETQYNKSF